MSFLVFDCYSKVTVRPVISQRNERSRPKKGRKGQAGTKILILEETDSFPVMYSDGNVRWLNGFNAATCVLR
jgi:hypothetical protein